MKQEFFKNLPSEIVIDILSRLPVRTIVSCKCVCKSWLDLVESLEFAKSHISKSVRGLAILQTNIDSESYNIVEFEDGVDLEHLEVHCNLVNEFGFPYSYGKLLGSLNGLLFLMTLRVDSSAVRVCNPITREYIELHFPGEYARSHSQVITYGFGASKMTGQYKVVRIFQVMGDLLEITKSECQVHTLGTGSWRIMAPGGRLVYDCTIGAFMNGNLHWLVFDLSDGCQRISCFDLETELFRSFSSAPLPEGSETQAGLFALEDCLCLCDNTSYDEIVIWLMKEYGVEKSWTKEFVISKFPDFAGQPYVFVRPVQVFKDGDILMAWGDYFLFYYSKKNNTTQKIDMFRPDCYLSAILHTPSFLSLKSFGMENITSF